ncbi:MAG: TetR/AcrR family transcriptional regulator [Actinomycetota bacterium]
MTETPAPARAGARERILTTAGSLFYNEGFGAVGIDRIIAEAGVAKATLYHHFASKDDLIVAYLEQANHSFWRWIDGDVDATARGGDLLVEIFDLVERQATDDNCRGCTFQVTAAEFPDPAHPAHIVAARHKREALDRFTTIADEAALTRPADLGAALVLLMDGAWAATRMFGADNHSKGLRTTVETLVAAHTPAATTHW